MTNEFSATGLRTMPKPFVALILSGSTSPTIWPWLLAIEFGDEFNRGLLPLVRG